MILKLMILSSLHVYELIVTTSSLSSFRKPKSTLETPVDQMPTPSNAGFQATYCTTTCNIHSCNSMCMYILFGIWITLNYIGG